MLPIYNKANQILVLFSQYPDWKLLNVNSDEEKISILKKLAKTAIDKPIVLSEDILEQMPDDISNMELFKDKIVGYIIHATVDEVNFCLDITGRIFVKIFLEISKDEQGYNYSNSCLLFDYKKVADLFEISETLEKKIEEIKQTDSEEILNENDLS